MRSKYKIWIFKTNLPKSPKSPGFFNTTLDKKIKFVYFPPEKGGFMTRLCAFLFAASLTAGCAAIKPVDDTSVAAPQPWPEAPDATTQETPPSDTTTAGPADDQPTELSTRVRNQSPTPLPANPDDEAPPPADEGRPTGKKKPSKSVWERCRDLAIEKNYPSALAYCLHQARFKAPEDSDPPIL
jgi:hypothetical protein